MSEFTARETYPSLKQKEMGWECTASAQCIARKGNNYQRKHHQEKMRANIDGVYLYLCYPLPKGPWQWPWEGDVAVAVRYIKMPRKTDKTKN